MEFRLLGPMEVSRAGDLIPVGGARDRALLAALLLRANTVAPVRYLVEAAWERPPASPETNLRTYVSRLRRRLADSGDELSRVVTRDGGYLFVVEPGELDVAEFERQVHEGRQALAIADHPTAAQAFGAAVSAWRGDPLPDQRHGPALEAELTRLRGRRLEALEGYARARIELGNAGEVAEDLTGLVDRHPLHEELWAQLMIALYRSGRRAAALETYVTAHARLAEEAGIAPGPRLQELHEAILRDSPTLAPEALPAARVLRPAQLPADLATFTGRCGQVDRLTSLLSSTDRPPAVVITAIDGMAGIGKTALATHVAHLVRERFPDGQLFLDLHGHTEGVQPLDPADALDRLLRSLGVPGDQIPRDIDARAAFYRTQLADRPMLIVLDNAASERQVAPLLPANPASVVLITSRRRLSGLEHAVPLSLEVLPVDDAALLFTRVAGADRVADPVLLNEVIDRCGRLPLAIRIAAARLRSRPAWTLARLADRLSDERHRLDELGHDERGVSAAFTLSYRQLDAEPARTFRLLGLHPGPDADPYTIAALADTPVREVERALDELLQVHLLTEHTPGRFVLHDLLRAFAAELASKEDPADDRDRALRRLLDHYLISVGAALDHTDPAYARHRPSVHPATTELPPLDAASADTWLETELPNLLAAARTPVGGGQTIVLAQLLGRWLSAHGHNDQALALHEEALATARSLGDGPAEAYLLVGLGDCHSLADRYAEARGAYLAAVRRSEAADDSQPRMRAIAGLGDCYRLTDDHEQARDRYHQALAMARRSGDQLVELRALRGLGVSDAVTGNLTSAQGHFVRALRIARSIGDRGQEARSLASLAMTHRHAGRLDPAFGCARRALDIVRDVGDLGAEISVRNEIGRLHRLAGELDTAVTHSRHALDLARSLGDRLGESQVLKAVGEIHLAADRPEEAVACYRAAVEIAREIRNLNDLFEGLYGAGRALLAAGRRGPASDRFTEALSVAKELGQSHDVARAEQALTGTAATGLAAVGAANLDDTTRYLQP